MYICNKNIEIRFIETWSENEIVNLYKEAGWWKDSYESSSINLLIKRSFAFAIVIDKKLGKTIGMGRILSDGISDAYLQDIVILKKYRGQGIGSRLVQFLVNHCLSIGIKWIGLIAEPGQDGFYSSSGFITMKNYIPMLYQVDD